MHRVINHFYFWICKDYSICSSCAEVTCVQAAKHGNAFLNKILSDDRSKNKR